MITINTGTLLKVSIVPIDENITEVFNKMNTEELLVPEIISDWLENKPNDLEYRLIQTDNYAAQFNLMPDAVKNTIELHTLEGLRHFILVKDIHELKTNELKRHEELSGEGTIIPKFSLSFIDFGSRYLVDQESDFFNISDNEFIINSVRLTLDNSSPQTSRLKLTGRAAEKAAARKQHETN